MKHLLPALLLAGAMIAVALLAKAGLLPVEFGQYAPLVLLALFPGAWLRSDRSCSFSKRGQA